MNVPRVARWLLSRVIVDGDRDFFLGDLAEEFADRARSGGSIAARVWYWRQTLHSAWPLIRQRVSARRLAPHQQRGDPMWRDLLGDLRYTMRLSGRSPLASATVILTMVLGIGVTTAVFSVVNSVLLTPLPFSGAERTMQISLVLRDGSDIPTMSYPALQEFRRYTAAFSNLGAASSGTMTLTQGETPVQLKHVRVDEGYSSIFPVRPLIGRYFTKEEFQYGRGRVVMLSHGFWQRQFGGEMAIVGKSISLDNEPYTVVGVLPTKAYNYPDADVELMSPLSLAPGSAQMKFTSFWLSAVAMLKPGMSIEQGRADVAAMMKRIAAEHPESGFNRLNLKLTPLQDTIVGDVRQMLVLLSASVAAVLLIACVNIANLLLGRSHARAREFVVRAALGASRGRLARQLLTESMMLSVAGGAIGLALAPLLTRGLIALYPNTLPRVDEIGVDLRVLGFALGTTLLAGLLAGLPMARRAMGMNLTRDLRESGRMAGSAAQRWVGGALVISQVALSVTLLFAGSLMLRTFSTLSHTDPGFRPNQVTSFYLYPTNAKYPGSNEIANYYDAVEQSLSRLPGVRIVATGATIPLDNENTTLNPFVDKQRGSLPGGNPSVG
ncbi:MAG: ABC transporter permease, partial [Phycisphaerae bacterium]|nr:ABC transporter permease [Gemmatimonadaceae bacterium]